MLLQNWTFSSSPPCGGLLQSTNPINIYYGAAHLYIRRKPKASSKFGCLIAGTDSIAEIAHNKVLIAAAVSAAVGQLTKPFTAAILYRRTFDYKAAFQAGGFPSTHSCAAVATATSLGLERGFSDAIFGLAVVYASLTMYDAQGVRREVGTHAKTLNRVLSRFELNSFSSCDADSLIDSSLGNSSSNSESLSTRSLEEPSTSRPELSKNSLLLRSNHRMIQSSSMPISSCLTTEVEEELESTAHICGPLKESVGHTEIEVIAGAFFGFLVSLAICSF